MKKIYLLFCALVMCSFTFAQVVPVSGLIPGQKYNIKHVASGFCLQYLANGDGDFCMNSLITGEGSDVFDFDFTAVPTATVENTYNIGVAGKFFNGSGWKCTLGEATDATGQIALIADGDNFTMKTAWSNFLNSNTQTEGSRFYADKNTGAVFRLELSANALSNNELTAKAKIVLQAAITAVTDFYTATAAMEGDTPGHYPGAARQALNAAITSAQAVYDKTAATLNEVLQATNDVNTALTTYKASIITVDFAPLAGHKYRISNADVAGKVLNWNGQDGNNGRLIFNADEADDANQLFYFVPTGNEDEYNIYCLSGETKIYMANRGGGYTAARTESGTAYDHRYVIKYVESTSGGIDYFSIQTLGTNGYYYSNPSDKNLTDNNQANVFNNLSSYKFAFTDNDPDAPTEVSILSQTPAVNATNISVNTPVNVTFNGVVTSNDLSGVTINGVAAAASITENILTVVHADFENSTQYTVTIPAGAINGYAPAISWSFTTAGLAVASKTPAENAVNVAIDARVSVTFNTNVTAGILSGITINQTPAAASITGNVLTVEHANFELGTSYTVNIPSGAIAGFNEAVSWSFTTLIPAELPLAGKMYNIKNRGTALYLTVDESFNNANKTRINSLTGEANQIFELSEIGEGIYNIAVSGKYLTQSTSYRWDAALGNDADAGEAKFLLIPNGADIHIKSLFYQAQNVFFAPQAAAPGSICYLNTAPNGSFESWIFEEYIEPSTLETRSLIPENGARYVNLTPAVSVLFNKAIEAGNLSGITIKDAANNPVEGVTGTVSGSRLDIAYTGTLAFGTVYTVTVPAGAIVGYTQAISWSFTTATPVLPHDMRSYNIINVATGLYLTYPTVAPHVESIVSINNKIEGEGNERQIFQFQSPDTENSDVFNIAVFSGEYLTKRNGNAWLVELGTDPTVPAAQIRVTTEGNYLRFQALDNAGQVRYLGYQAATAGQPCFWDKSGDAALWRLEQVELPIALVRTNPAAGAGDVALDAPVTATFNQSVTAGDLTGITIKNAAGEAVPGVQVTIDDYILKIAHAAFGFSTTYTVTIPAGAITGFTEAKTWSFTTKAAPAVDSTTPGANATNVDIKAIVSVTFTETVTAANLAGITIKDAAATVLQGVSATLNEATLIIAHPLLEYNTGYTVTIPANTINGISGEYSWSFTTTSVPTVNSTTPVADAVDVALTTLIRVTFNKAPVAGSAGLTGVTLKNAAGDNLTGNVTISGSALVIAKATGVSLANGTVYTVTVPANTIKGVTDEIKFSFTTIGGTAIENVNAEKVSVYPTISKGNVTIATPGKASVKVLDISGRTLADYQSNGNLSIDLNYANGLYIIKVDDNGKVSSHKVILKK